MTRFGNERFKHEVTVGKRYEHQVAQMFRSKGFAVQETGVDFTDEGLAGQPRQFRTEPDLFVAEKKIEVKSLTCGFTGPWDYPYSTALIGEVAQWQRKEYQPHAIVLVSRREKDGYAVVRMSDRHLWKERRVNDTVRGYKNVSYEVPRERLVPLDDLIIWIAGIEAKAQGWL